MVHNMEDWVEYCRRANVELQMLWWEKLSHLTDQRLDRALLDFAEA